jgi:carbamoyl-phosphate synthase/aspartate carbamoyltransferase/dihydroorotase
MDPHVHLREPGATHKEDWSSGTAAALAGGFVCVLAMPNTQPALTTAEVFQEVERLATERARCDYGLYLGGSQENVGSAPSLAAQTCGLKMYLDQTYGPLRLDDLSSVIQHFAHWPAGRPVVVHAEGRSLALPLLLSGLHHKAVHVAHVSRAEEIALIRLAKERGWPVTCEVTPHHLFLDEEDIPGITAGRAEVRPRLARASDREALWANLEVIDCFATDHAPHTLAEKDGPNPPPGFPGLETALPLLLGAVREGRLTMPGLVARMHDNPLRIWNLPAWEETFIEVDPEASWTVRGRELLSRCGWTPFEGWEVRGRVARVILRGKLAYQDGQVLAPPGFGHDLFRHRAEPFSSPRAQPRKASERSRLPGPHS